MPSVCVLSSPVDTDLLSLPVERYLHDFRGGLLSLPESERDLIVTEVRGQIAAQAQVGDGAVTALLTKLGSPERLAERFTLRHELTVGVQRSNPAMLVWAILKMAVRSLVALIGGVFVAMSFFVGVVMAMIPVLRLVTPDAVFVTRGERFSVTVSSGVRPPSAEALAWDHACLFGLAGVVLVVLSLAMLRGVGRILLRDIRRKTAL